MTYPKQLFLAELPIATTAQIDKGIEQLEALFSEHEEYRHCLRDRRPAPTRENKTKMNFSIISVSLLDVLILTL